MWLYGGVRVDSGISDGSRLEMCLLVQIVELYTLRMEGPVLAHRFCMKRVQPKTLISRSYFIRNILNGIQ